MAITEADLLIQINDKQGGSEGQLLLSDVTVSGSRDNTLIYGIGNKQPQEVDPGNEEFSMSVEQYMTKEAAELLREIVNNTPTPESSDGADDVIPNISTGGQSIDAAYLLFGDGLEMTIGDFRWNDFEINASEDGEVTVSLDADLLNVELNNPSN
jgi:hypothetical protein